MCYSANFQHYQHYQRWKIYGLASFWSKKKIIIFFPGSYKRDFSVRSQFGHLNWHLISKVHTCKNKVLKKIYQMSQDTPKIFLWVKWTKRIKKSHFDLKSNQERDHRVTYSARASEINFFSTKVQKWQFLTQHEKFWAKSWNLTKFYIFCIFRLPGNLRRKLSEYWEISAIIWFLGHFSPGMHPGPTKTHSTEPFLVQEELRARIWNFVIFGLSDYIPHTAYFC